MNTALARYTGGTPGADTNTYVIFDTTVASPQRGMFQQAGVARCVVEIAHSQAFTLTGYWSNDGGATWRQYTTETFGIPAAGVTRARDYLVEHYRDWKLVAVNGGVAQAVWDVSIALASDRATAM